MLQVAKHYGSGYKPEPAGKIRSAGVYPPLGVHFRPLPTIKVGATKIAVAVGDLNVCIGNSKLGLKGRQDIAGGEAP